MDARTRRKLRRAAERTGTQVEIDGEMRNIDWYCIGPGKEEKPYVAVPGKDFYVETPEYQAKINSNSWDENFDEVVNTIKELTKEDSTWSWARNMNCKYVDIRIDMRDGGFVLRADGKRISLDALKWQYKSEYENERK